MFEYNLDSSVEITKYISSDKDIIIPELINGYEVKNIIKEISLLEPKFKFIEKNTLIFSSFTVLLLSPFLELVQIHLLNEPYLMKSYDNIFSFAFFLLTYFLYI